MWRIGFRIWSAWQYIRLGVPGVLLAVVVLLTQGMTVLFWLATLMSVSVVFGARVVLTGLSRKEPNTLRPTQRR